MKKKVMWKGIIREMIPFVFATVLFTPFFQSCQKEEIVEPENTTLKSAVVPEINLIYPQAEVIVSVDFNITFSSTCGKIMLERGYILEYDAGLDTYNEVYSGLTCETENLQWKSVGEDIFETCAGETVTENIETPGTYVYRAKLNQKTIKGSGCEDCATFIGNQFECFMITVVECTQGTFTDERDGHVYKTITIGNQTWMAENLAYETETGSYAPRNDEGNVAIYGRLYTWEAAKIACPDGWHLPTDDEWKQLEMAIGMSQSEADNTGFRGTDEGTKLKATSGWEYDGNGTDNFGFSALPSGWRFPHGVFSIFGTISAYWTSTDYTTTNALARHLTSYTSGVDRTVIIAKTLGLSIRCVKDGSYGTFTDERDSHEYKTVKIGTQTWMAENLAHETENGSFAYNNDESNVAIYGRLYTWEAALSACPNGWHLPTDDEWKQLEMFIGMNQSEADDIYWRGTNEGTKLKATSDWLDDGNGTDNFGFLALPGGGYLYGNFGFTGSNGYWWSATEQSSGTAWMRGLRNFPGMVYRGDNNKGDGYSVRCVRD